MKSSVELMSSIELKRETLATVSLRSFLWVERGLRQLSLPDVFLNSEAQWAAAPPGGSKSYRRKRSRVGEGRAEEGQSSDEGMWTARLKVTEELKKKPRRQRGEARGQVGKRDTSEEAKREGRTREWSGRCGTKRDKREVAVRFRLGWEVSPIQKGIIMIPSNGFLGDMAVLHGED